MRDALMLVLDMAGLFGCYGLISFFNVRREFWGFQALLFVFWAFLLGFIWLIAGDVFRMSGLTDLSAIWNDPLRPAIYRSIIVLGLWIGNFWLRQRWNSALTHG